MNRLNAVCLKVQSARVLRTCGTRQGVAHGGDDVSNAQNKPYQDLMEAFLRPGPNTALDLLPLGLYRRHDAIGENYWFVLSLDASRHQGSLKRCLWHLGAPRICFERVSSSWHGSMCPCGKAGTMSSCHQSLESSSPNHNRTGRYTFTNPSPDTVVRSEDCVFYIQRTKPWKEEP